MAPSNNGLQSLRKAALSFPDVEVAIACKGTALESHSFKVAKKSFLFLRPAQVMLKLDASLEEAKHIAERNPEACKVGAGGWVTIQLGQQAVSIKEIKRWIDESYELFAATKGAKTSVGTRKRRK
jgi:predicted DNA-binding protein (MmcQ/YjbR family)